MYVGKGLAASAATDIVRFHRHFVHVPGDGQHIGDVDTAYEEACVGCREYDAATGILTVRFDHTVLDHTTEFTPQAQPGGGCLPTSLCRFNADTKACERNPSADLLSYDAAASRGPLADAVCEFATRLQTDYREEPTGGALAAKVSLAALPDALASVTGASAAFVGFAPDASTGDAAELTPTGDAAECAASGSQPRPPSPPASPPAPPAAPSPPAPPPAPARCADASCSPCPSGGWPSGGSTFCCMNTVANNVCSGDGEANCKGGVLTPCTM